MEKIELVKKPTTPEKVNTQSSVESLFKGINLSEDDILILLVVFLLLQDKKIDNILLIALVLIFLDIDFDGILKSIF
jgi:hypothetical protein